MRLLSASAVVDVPADVEPTPRHSSGATQDTPMSEDPGEAMTCPDQVPVVVVATSGRVAETVRPFVDPTAAHEVVVAQLTPSR